MNGIMNRTRLTLLVCAAALVALALPGSASASRAHLLKLYKVEQHVDLMGQDGDYQVQCPNNDLALQGMWRVDNVEQDNDYINDGGPGGSWGRPDWDVLRSVRPVKAAAIDDSTYDFVFTPLAGGEVQLKLWVTCLGWKSETVNSHYVSWQISNPYTTTVTLTNPTAKVQQTSSNCPSGYIAVQPGFEFTTGDADVTESDSANSNKAWTWSLDNGLWDTTTNTVVAKFTRSCLELRSQAASDGSGHKHRIVVQKANAFAPSTVLASGTSEVQAQCGQLYKGMLGGWDYSSFGGTDYSTQLFFLGMDPRIKIRAFKWINNGAAVNTSDVVSLLCFKDKTT